MKKRNLFLLVLPLLLSACSGGNEKPQTDIKVQNLRYEGTTLKFDAIDGATGYSLRLSKNDVVVFNDVIGLNSIDLAPLNVYGNVKVSVCPLFTDKLAKYADLDIVSLAKFDEMFFEAETGCYNIGTGKDVSNYRWNECASDTYYVGGIDDAGQGVYFNILMPFSGTFELQCFYTSLPTYVNAHDDVLLNDEFVGQLHFDEGRGWFGPTEDAEHIDYFLHLPCAKLSINFKKGWNTLSIFKNGSPEDDWGGNAELDYFKIIGNNQTYNPDDIEGLFGAEPAYYRLEGEMGSPRKFNKESRRRECKNAPIVEKGMEKFSNSFVLGNIESDFDGVEWRFKAKKSGKYAIKLCYSSMAFPGSKKAKPTYIVTDEPIDLGQEEFFDFYPHYRMAELDYTEDWSTFALTDEVQLDLQKGVNYIYCLLLDEENSGYFEIDYADIRMVD